MTKHSRRPLQWTPAAERLLLEWVEQNKGPDGTLRQNVDLALDELATHLRDECSTFTHLSAITLKSRINDKLRRVWNKYRLDKYQTTPFTATTFFDEGIAALDQEKLGSNFADLFPSEDPQDHVANADNSPATPGQLGAKRKAEDTLDSNVNPGNDSSPKRRRSAESARSATPASSNDGSLRITTNDVNESEPEILLPELPSNVVKDIAAVGQLHQTRDTPSAGSQANLAFTTTARPPPPPPPPPPPKHFLEPSQFRPYGPNAGYVEFYENHYEKMKVLLDETVHTEDKLLIEGMMERIRSDIATLVQGYMDEARVPYEQPVFLDSTIVYPAELKELVEGTIPNRHRREFEALQRGRQSAICWRDFTRSLLGQAVTMWCLNRAPSSNQFFYRSLQNIIQEVHEQYFDPVVVANLKEKLWTRYMDKHFLPICHARAEQMAVLALQYLDILLPRQTGFFVREVVSGVRWCGKRDQLPSIGGAPARDPLREPAERATFRARLTKIFEYALEWRMEVGKSVHSIYNFFWPKFGDAYSRDRKQDHSGGGIIRGRVFLALSPIVDRTCRARVVEEWLPERVVSEARVIMIKPLDQEPDG